jgi:hypothetical protein
LAASRSTLRAASRSAFSAASRCARSAASIFAFSAASRFACLAASRSAALYTFANKRNRAILCLAHVTNTMGLAGQDFEKGQAQGANDALLMLEALAGCFQ